MKKAVLVAGIILFFVVVLGLLLFKAFNSSPSDSPATQADVIKLPSVTEQLKNVDTSTPEGAVYACYTWYLHYVGTQPVSKQVISTNSTIAHCFTANFITAWSANFDTPYYLDPVLIAADLGDSWLTSTIETAKTSATSNSSIVSVILGKGGTGERAITVRLLNVNGEWKIDSVENPG